jgi:hypothetical protein
MQSTPVLCYASGRGGAGWRLAATLLLLNPSFAHLANQVELQLARLKACRLNTPRCVELCAKLPCRSCHISGATSCILLSQEPVRQKHTHIHTQQQQMIMFMLIKTVMK